MTQQEKTNNQFQEDRIAPVDRDYALETQDRETEIVYIAELNGEFFTVDYSQEDSEPTVTPLKIVEFMNPETAEESGKLTAVESQNDGNLQPFVASEVNKPTSGKFSENKSLILGIGLGLLIAWGGTKLFSNSSPSEPVATDTPATVANAQERSVTIASVEESTVDRTIEVSGTVEALELIPITSEVAGLQIQEILVDEGAKVTKGQVLARLKNDTIQAEYAQARAAVDAAQARLAELQAGTRSEELARARERVKREQAALEQAKSDLDLVSKRVVRNRNLEAEGAISRDRLDEINTQERIARATLAQAEASLQEATQELKELETGARPEVISQARAELAQAQGQLQFATVQLNNTQIEAVADGIIAERNVKVGDLTSNTQTLFSIIENGALELQLQVPETDLSQIDPGQKVTISNSQFGSQPIIGRVREIDPIVDSTSRQATVKVNLPDNSKLQPGMFLEAAITTAQVPGLTVPIKALLPQTEDNAIAFVVADNNQVESRTVKMGDILANNRIEVVEGLESGERVVVKGAAYLKDGDRISLTE